MLLKHPDLYNKAREKLPPDKMITSLNRRIYETIINTLDSGRSLDISMFAEKLLPAEIGYLVSLQNGDKALKNPETVLKDCIGVILEEDIISAADGKTNLLRIGQPTLKILSISNRKEKHNGTEQQNTRKRN